MWLTVFMPAYNEAHGLRAAVLAVHNALQALAVTHEFVLVNDGSRDSTGAVAEALRAELPHVHVIHHPHNQGIGACFGAAAQVAQGAWFIFIPADLALEVSELRHYVAASAHADIVVGCRTNRSDYSWWRHVISWLNILLIQRLFGMTERQFQYICLYRRTCLTDIDLTYTHSAFFLAEILIKNKALGRRLVEVDIHYTPRLTGQATGAKIRLLFATVRDMAHFWWRWVRLGPVRASQPRRMPS